MSGVNKVILVGNLGNDPESKSTQSGTTITNITVATSESWTKDGNKEEKTEWHRVVMFNKLGEIAAKYLNKGSKVYIEGKLQTRKWQDNNGNDRYTTEIVANQMQMLDSKGSGHQAPANPKPNAPQADSYNNGGGSFEDDIPFSYIDGRAW